MESLEGNGADEIASDTEVVEDDGDVTKDSLIKKPKPKKGSSGPASGSADKPAKPIKSKAVANKK